MSCEPDKPGTAMVMNTRNGRRLCMFERMFTKKGRIVCTLWGSCTREGSFLCMGYSSYPQKGDFGYMSAVHGNMAWMGFVWE